MEVKFYDLQAQYRSIKKEIDEAILKELDQATFYDSPSVEALEATFAEKHRSKYCVAVNSGTSALHATLLALNIRYGDEVIVPSNSFFATAEAVSLTGAVPVMVDCEPTYFTLDAQHLQRVISAKTKAIIPVHLYGQPAFLDEIKCIADKNDLFLIEDCAHAHLAMYQQQPVGTFGIAGCFSFFPGKNLGAFGEGGAILTNDTAIYNELKKIREHGAVKKYYHERIGHHYRMEGLQAAILNVKMKYIEEWTSQRRKNAAAYRDLLQDCSSIILPKEAPANHHVYHLFVVRCQQRDKLKTYLAQKGIETGLHYPLPIHLQKAYSNLNYDKGSLPVSESLARETLSLPISEQLNFQQIEYVAQCIKRFYMNA